MTKSTAPAPAATDGLDTCLTTATSAAKDGLGDGNAASDATVTITTNVTKDGKSQKKAFSAAVALSRDVGELVDVPAAEKSA